MPLIIFDLDGTLVDSRVDLANSVNEIIQEHGAAPLPVPQIASYIGEGAKVLVERSLEAAGVDLAIETALGRFRHVYGRRLLEHTRPYPGVDRMLRDAAPQAALAVLTNKPEEPTRRLLDAFDLAELFQWVIGGDSAFPRKPDPAALRHLAHEAQAPLDAVLFVGDSMIDIETARAAGVRICVAKYGFGQLRGELVLSGDEILADDAAGVGRAIERFLRPAASPAGHSGPSAS
jgi:phosphoglycolate phosphatase